VQFIIKHDKRNKFSFTSLQSKYGQELLNHFHLQSAPFESIILYENQKCYSKSDAVIRILVSFGGAWKIIAALKIIPKFICDWIYDVIAKSRYKIFGRRDQCMVPTKELKEKFVDDLSFTP
jgi:predicted DCC family thiol-disulfide oxidoreductase YuxK